jgi:dTDP-4-dehydrorhamnose reductase
VTAAMTDVDRCELNPEMAYRINTLPFFTIVKYLSRVGGRIIQVSTDYVFSGEVGGYREYDKREPINVYGKSKMEAEDIITNSGIRYAIIRTSGIFGVRESSGKINFFLWVWRNLLEGKEIPVVKDQYYSPTLNTSLANAIVEIYNKSIDGILHFSSINRVSRYDFALLIADAFTLKSDLIEPVSMNEMRWTAKRPRDSSLSAEKSATILEKKPLKVEEEILLAKMQMSK